MESFKILIRASAAADLEKVPRTDLRRIIRRIEALAAVPRPRGSEKLSAQERFRLRQGDYRIIYSIDDESRTVDIVKIGHRSDVYNR
jgi:mRNA interferase RelE/StbE